MDNLWIIYGYGWLVQALWKIWLRKFRWWHSQYMEKYKMFQTTNKNFILMFHGMIVPSMLVKHGMKSKKDILKYVRHMWMKPGYGLSGNTKWYMLIKHVIWMDRCNCNYMNDMDHQVIWILIYTRIWSFVEYVRSAKKCGPRFSINR